VNKKTRKVMWGFRRQSLACERSELVLNVPLSVIMCNVCVCFYGTLGLCLRTKLQQCLPSQHKVHCLLVSHSKQTTNHIFDVYEKNLNVNYECYVLCCSNDRVIIKISC